jgi:hypothetical protein
VACAKAKRCDRKKKRRFPQAEKALLAHLSHYFFDTTSLSRRKTPPERLVKVDRGIFRKKSQPVEALGKNLGNRLKLNNLKGSVFLFEVRPFVNSKIQKQAAPRLVWY